MTANAASLQVEGTIGRGDFRLPISFAADAGEVVLVRGANGAGKTTLLRTIAGLEAIAQGEVRINEQLVDAGPTDAATFVPAHRRPVVMAFQEHRLFAHMTALANVEFGLSQQPNNRDKTTAAMDALEATGAAHLADHMPQTLSGGQAQRVGLARALAIKAPVLLVDEPLSAVDSATRTALRDVIAAQKATTIWVTHADPASFGAISATEIDLGNA